MNSLLQTMSKISAIFQLLSDSSQYQRRRQIGIAFAMGLTLEVIYASAGHINAGGTAGKLFHQLL
jgi:hypothetical protein